MHHMHRFGFLCIAAFALGACATANQATTGASESQWAANGWLSPGPTGDPEIIGLYTSRADCEDALADWLSRQVVGNPIHGECLPIDRH